MCRRISFEAANLIGSSQDDVEDKTTLTTREKAIQKADPGV